MSRDDEGRGGEGKDDEAKDDEAKDDEAKSGEAKNGDGRIGIFPSWSWVYGAVVIYGVLTIGVLILLTRILDFGTGP